MVSCLLLVTVHDQATFRSSIAGRAIMDVLLQNNIDIDALEREDCRREKLEALLKDKQARGQLPYSLVIYFGHGTADTWIGQPDGDLKPLVDSSNIGAFKGSIMVGITCLSSKTLLKMGIGKGVRGAIGFSDLLFLPMEQEGIRNYMADFLRTFILIPISLAKGYDIEDTVRQFRELCDEYIELYTKGNMEYGADAVKWMKHNRDNVEFIGHPNTQIHAKRAYEGLGMPLLR